MVPSRPNVSFSLRFAGIIERACKLAGQRVVILVDEYDKPMLQAIGNEELQKQFRIHCLFMERLKQWTVASSLHSIPV